MNKNIFFIFLIALPVVFFVTLSMDSKVTLENKNTSSPNVSTPNAVAGSKLSSNDKEAVNHWAALGIEEVGPADPPPFSIEGMDGKKVGLDDYKGKVIFLNFWATWCPPCVIEMPAMDRLYKELGGDGLAVVAINDYEPRARVEKFLKDKDYAFTILMDPSGKVSEAYRAMVLPSTFIINRNGQVVGRAIGMREWDSSQSISLFKELLNERNTPDMNDTKE